MKDLLIKFLGRCARQAIHKSKADIVAIVGSVGKSSTKNVFQLALKACQEIDSYQVSKKNYNNELGLPLSIFNSEAPESSAVKWILLIFKALLYRFGFIKIKSQVLILEMGADQIGDLEYLAKIAPPKTVVFTALGAEHIEKFGTIEQAINEEKSILKFLPQKNNVVLNIDDQYLQDIDSKKFKITSYGQSDKANVQIKKTTIVYDSEKGINSAGLEVIYQIQNKDYKIFLKNVFGTPHAYAVGALLAYLLAMQYDLENVIELLNKNYQGMPGRTRIIKGIKNTLLLDDSYNAQPQAMESAINDLANFPINNGGRRIIALGEMLELGDVSQEMHEKIGELIFNKDIDFLVTCGKMGRVVSGVLLKKGWPNFRAYHFDTSEEVGYFIQQNILREHDVVLIKGSQGSRMEKVTKELMADPLEAKKLLVRQYGSWARSSSG